MEIHVRDSLELDSHRQHVMSNTATQWAWSVGGIKATDKCLLVRLADRAAQSSQECWPGVESLARDCCMDRKTVFAALDRLEKKGLIRRNRRPNQTTVYVVCVDCEHGPETGTSEHEDGYQKRNVGSTETGTPEVPKQEPLGVPFLGHKPKGNPHLTLTEPPVGNAPSYTPAFNTFWEMYPNRKGKKKAFEAWQKLSLLDRDAVLADVPDRAKRDREWIRQGGQFIPHASTYLNQRRWEDDITAETAHEAHQRTGRRESPAERTRRLISERRAAEGR